MARALRAFRDGTQDDWDWSGALLVADCLDDFGLVRTMLEGLAGVEARHRKK